MASLTNRSPRPPGSYWVKAIREPSGDHTGSRPPLAFVSRCRSPPNLSTTNAPCRKTLEPFLSSSLVPLKAIRETVGRPPEMQLVAGILSCLPELGAAHICNEYLPPVVHRVVEGNVGTVGRPQQSVRVVVRGCKKLPQIAPILVHHIQKPTAVGASKSDLRTVRRPLWILDPEILHNLSPVFAIRIYYEEPTAIVSDIGDLRTVRRPIRIPAGRDGVRWCRFRPSASTKRTLNPP